MAKLGKCEVFEPVCPNYDKINKQPKYPKARRISMRLVGLRLSGGSSLLMCEACKRARLIKYPELEKFQGKSRIDFLEAEARAKAAELEPPTGEGS